jgi:hypothetical protein
MCKEMMACPSDFNRRQLCNFSFLGFLPKNLIPDEQVIVEVVPKIPNQQCQQHKYLPLVKISRQGEDQSWVQQQWQHRETNSGKW